MKRTIRTGLVLCAMLTPALASAAWDAVVDWARETPLSTATSGVVTKVTVHPGQTVDKGALLLQLDQRALQAGVAQGKAEQAYAGLLRDEAQRELERAEELYARTLLAEHDLNVAKIEYARADAAYQRSRALYHQAQEALRNSELRAPFSARVVERLVEPGQTVVTRLQAQPMIVVVAADKRLARFNVSVAEAERFAVGGASRVELNGRSYDGIVQAVIHMADSNEVTVEVEFEGGQGTLPGAPARVSLP